MIKETHNVTTIRDAATGTVTYEAWTRDNKHDRTGGPAISVRDAATGAVTREEWWKDGQNASAGGPAISERDAATGIVTYEVWLKYGMYHRMDGPAITRRDAATGTVTYEEWRKDGRLIEPLVRPDVPLSDMREAFQKLGIKLTQEQVSEASWFIAGLAAKDQPVLPARSPAASPRCEHT